jgi:hypothetical protein
MTTFASVSNSFCYVPLRKIGISVIEEDWMRVFQQYISRLLPVVVVGVLSACSPSSHADQPATPDAAIGDCAQGFVVVTPEAAGCGFTLTTAGRLQQDGRTIADPLVVSYRQDASGNTPVPAGQVVLFPPSPSGRYRILQACEGTAADALCWKVFVFDRESGQLREAVAGKYGPDRWVSWSPDEQHAALVSRNEGASWVHAVEAASGQSVAFPDSASNENWQIQPETLAWTGPRSFNVMVVRCTGCAAKQETIQF